jgi:hypothetical protein
VVVLLFQTLLLEFLPCAPITTRLLKRNTLLPEKCAAQRCHSSRLFWNIIMTTIWSTEMKHHADFLPVQLSTIAHVSNQIKLAISWLTLINLVRPPVLSGSANNEIHKYSSDNKRRF